MMILEGDCLELLTEIPNNTFNLVIDDPPYWEIASISDWLPIAKQWYRTAREDATCYIWCGIGEKSDSLTPIKAAMIEAGWTFKNLLTWRKQRGYGTQRNWMYVREECLMFVKGDDWTFNVVYSDEERKVTPNPEHTKSKYKRLGNVWSDVRELTIGGYAEEHLGHSHQKPEELIRRLILASSNEGDLVADGHVGSGTTAAVAKKEGRGFWGCDIDHHWVDVSLNRVDFVE